MKLVPGYQPTTHRCLGDAPENAQKDWLPPLTSFFGCRIRWCPFTVAVVHHFLFFDYHCLWLFIGPSTALVVLLYVCLLDLISFLSTPKTYHTPCCHVRVENPTYWLIQPLVGVNPLLSSPTCHVFQKFPPRPWDSPSASNQFDSHWSFVPRAGAVSPAGGGAKGGSPTLSTHATQRGATRLQGLLEFLESFTRFAGRFAAGELA